MPLRDVSEKRIGILIVFNDVTELKQLENMRRDFVANVSHEIKTPLTAIKGFVETLQLGGVEKAEERERFLGIISNHVDRLSAIVDDLLNLSRIEREDEEKTIHRTDVQLRPVIQNAIGICRPTADDRGIALDLVSCDLSIVGRIDPSLIEQALVNLLDNAIKYSNRESRVEVSATANDADIRIEVRDHGIGISREHIPRLFERFYRVDKARSRKLGGTGLGLSIVKHIVQAHGGEVSVESSPGAGSFFTLTLPKA
jgi:two-component system, OmpR family, phosphate regulon sensor histidine kinase PhoR